MTSFCDDCNEEQPLNSLREFQEGTAMWENMGVTDKQFVHLCESCYRYRIDVVP